MLERSISLKYFQFLHSLSDTGIVVYFFYEKLKHIKVHSAVFLNEEFWILASFYLT